MLKMLAVLILALVAGRGLYLLNDGVRNLLRAGSSAGWPKVQGLVVRTEDTRHELVYSSQAIVRYTAGGKEYSTDLVSFGESLNPFDRDVAGLLRLRYPDGSKVSVSYDPSEPKIAVLQPGRRAVAFSPLGVSLAFLLPVAFCLMQFPAVSRSLERTSESIHAIRDMVNQARGGDVVRSDGPRQIEIQGQAGAAFPMPGFGIIPAIMLAIFGTLACVGGVLLLANGLPKTYYGFVSRGWPTTAGEVIVNDGIAAVSARQRLHNTVILPPAFQYRYEVAGTSHVNSIRRFRTAKRGDNAEQAKMDAPEDLPAGTKVKVAYFPADPDISVLEPGNDGAAFVLPGVGFFLLSLSAAIFIWAIPSFL
jgi:hypothetical protein